MVSEEGMKINKLIKEIIYILLKYSAGLYLRNLYLDLLGKTWCSVILYHRVDPTLSFDPIDINIHPHEFKRQMLHLKKSYNVISVAELLDTINNKGKFKPKTVCITFDDSYRSIYEFAFPILKELDLPACFFINDGFLSSEREYPWDEVLDRNQDMMSWEEVHEMLDQNFEIGVHTTNHPDLAKLEKTEATAEIYGSKRMLEQHLGVKLDYFSIPTGGKNNYTQETIEIVKASGFTCCFTAYGGFVRETSDVFQLERMSYSSDYWSVNEFCADLDRLFYKIS
jgi:peptidoglycan/xylan/chitin deacetylase (PgdA/CDA1 family)